jgi:hypothetical protein
LYPAHGVPPWKRSDYLLLFATALFGAAVGWHFVTPYHNWGDDWAGYVLQARAIEAGTIAAEMERNGALLRAGDRLLGPSAYPWGFPALLWLTGGATSLALPLMKLVGVVSLGLACAATFAVGRFLLGPLAALLAVASGALQPALVLSVDQILSDLPFLAISMLALLLIVLLWRHASAHGEIHWGLTAGIVALAMLGYSVRSNGVAIPPVFGLAMWMLVRDGAVSGHELIPRLSIAAAGIAAAVLAYWALLADGSLYALSYVTLSPTVMAGQLRSFAGDATLLTPLAGLPREVQIVVMGALVALVIVGARVGRRIGLIVLSCALLHLLLLVSIDFIGSVRYLFPIVPPLAILAIAGAVRLLRGTGASSALGPRTRASVVMAMLGAVTALQLSVAAVESSRFAEANRVQGPVSESAGRAFHAAAEATAPDGRVAFFKARAYRLVTGREAVVVSDPGRAVRVPCHLLYLPLTDYAAQSQVPEVSLRAMGFTERYRNQHFVLLCDRRVERSRSARSRARGYVEDPAARRAGQHRDRRRAWT